MVSQVAFPESAGEGGLQEALKVSVTKKRLTQNKSESIWHRKFDMSTFLSVLSICLEDERFSPFCVSLSSERHKG